MTVWVDVIARARGLRTHRLSPTALQALMGAPDFPTLGRDLRQAGFPVPEGAHRLAALDLAIRRHAAAELQILERWCGPRAAALPVLFDEEDRRSLRALIRGSVQGASAEARIAGLIPTPSLPERALAELAGAHAPSAVVVLLAVWNHPFAAALREPAAATAPDLLRLEVALNREWARRAVAGARKGGAELRGFVSDAIDFENATTAIALAGASAVRAGEQFLGGGRLLDLTTYMRAALGARAAARHLLAGVFAGTRYEDVFRVVGETRLDDALLTARVQTLRVAARREPLGLASVLWYALELRAEAVALSRKAWGLALGGDPETMATAVGEGGR